MGLLLACGCGKNLDPTEIFTPPPPLAHGANLTFYYKGDQSNTPVIHVWVADAADSYIVKTLLTTSGQAQYSCGAPYFCPCEGALADGGTYGYWPLYCKANDNNAENPAGSNGYHPFTTDANSSATKPYQVQLPLYFGWDWTTHNGSTVAPGSYVVHAEISGYYYGGAPGEAQITVTYPGAPGVTGSSSGTWDGHWNLVTATWTD